MTTLSKLSLFLASLIVVALAECADNPARINYQQQLPIQTNNSGSH